MTTSNRLCPGLVLALLGLAWPSPLPAAAPELKGRLVDGSAMLRQSKMSALDDNGFRSDAPRVPLAGRGFQLELVSEQRGGPWTATTDSDGRFAVTLTGLERLPDGPALVASIAGKPPQFSLAVAPVEGGETEFRLYGVTEDTRFLPDSRVDVIFDLVKDPESERQLLDVRVLVDATNFSGDLFVGRMLDGLRNRRAVVRVPLPENVKIIKNTAVAKHNASAVGGWTITRDGWALIDTPIPPFSEAPNGVRYKLQYRVPAYQEQAFAFPVDMQLGRMLVWGVHLDMELTCAALEGKFTENGQDPETGTGKPRAWDIAAGRNVDPQRTPAVGVGLTIDSAILKQLNRGAVSVVLGLVVGSLVALLLGLVIGSRGPRVDRVLSEAAGEEIIERIAQLDAQYEKRKVPEKDYKETRERLLSLARYEVPELAPGPAQSVDAPAAAPSSAETARPEPALPARARDVVRRIREISEEGSGDPKKVQERLLLLEDLARILDEEG